MEKSLWVWQLCNDTYELFEIRVKEAPILVRSPRGSFLPNFAFVIVDGADKIKSSPNIYETEAEARRSMLNVLKASLSDARNKAAICLDTGKSWAARADSLEDQLKQFKYPADKGHSDFSYHDGNGGPVDWRERELGIKGPCSDCTPSGYSLPAWETQSGKPEF